MVLGCCSNYVMFTFLKIDISSEHVCFCLWHKSWIHLNIIVAAFTKLLFTISSNDCLCSTIFVFFQTYFTQTHGVAFSDVVFPLHITHALSHINFIYSNMYVHHHHHHDDYSSKKSDFFLIAQFSSVNIHLLSKMYEKFYLIHLIHPSSTFKNVN